MKVAVIGSGAMGRGIGQLCIEHGVPTILAGRTLESVSRGFAAIKQRLDGKVQKGKLTADQAATVMSRLEILPDRCAAAAQADVVFEAVVEDLDVKKLVFADVAQAAPSHTILTSNTSTLSIAKLGGATPCPSRVAGMHFFNPAPVMKLVEVVSSTDTLPSTTDACCQIAEVLGRTPVRARDVPGFIVNRMLLLLYNEAAWQVHNGWHTAEDVDTAMRLGANHPMGPLQIADFAGVDIVLAAMEAVFAATADERYRPCPLLVEMVKAGKLGAKTGEGFYRHTT
jgi:3-hydroxybutyryl-CoA dehydrogenase